MEPNQNVQTNGIGQTTTNASVAPVNNTAAPTPTKASEAPAMEATNVKKNSKGMVLGMIMLGILAVGGIAFGVWEMMDGNARVEGLNEQISTLKAQNSELMEKVEELEEAHSEVQADVEDNQEAIEEMQEEVSNQEEEGYHILSFGDCVGDGGTSQGGTMIVKCDVETSVGAGKIVYDSESNTMKLVLN